MTGNCLLLNLVVHAARAGLELEKFGTVMEGLQVGAAINAVERWVVVCIRCV